METHNIGTAADPLSEASGHLTTVDAMETLLPLEKPLNIQSVSLAILSTLAVVFALHWAQKFLIPLCFGILIAYTLNPVVLWLERLRVPRLLGSILVMAVLMSAGGLLTNSLLDEFQSIVEALPESTHKVAHALQNAPGTLRRLQSAATEIEQAAGAAGAAGDTRRSGSGVKKASVPDAPSFKVSDWALAGSMGAMAMLGQVIVVSFLVFFLLISGDTFKRKLVQFAGPSMSVKKTTVHILDEVNSSVQAYMFMLLVTNVFLALLTWLVLRTIGLENAGAWAAVAGLLHLVPYVGTLLIVGATGLSAFIQFESLSVALLVAGSSLVIATLVGTFITTWMTGRLAKMNPAAVFIALLFWGWLWGVWGMLLGVPIIVIIKVIAQHVDHMKAIARLLSE